MPELPESFVPDEGSELPSSFIPEKFPELPVSFVPDKTVSDRLGEVLSTLVSPISPVLSGERSLESILPGPEPESLVPKTPESPIGQAVLGGISGALSPLVQAGLAGPKAALRFNVPTEPIGIAATLLGPILGVSSTAVRSIVKSPVAKIGLREASERLARASSLVPPEPSIRVVTPSTPKQVIGTLLERQARPRLNAEQAILGLKQTESSTRSLSAEGVEMIRGGRPFTWRQGEQVSEAVSEAVRTGEMDAPEAARILGMENIVGANREVMAQHILTMKSDQGRSLGAWGQIAKEFKKQYGGVLEKTVRESLETPSTPWQTFSDGWRRMDNIRRAIMVSQFSTTARNVISQGARYSLNVLEDASAGFLGAVSGKVSPSKSLSLASEDLVSFLRNLTPQGRLGVNRILSNFPEQAARLTRAPILDVTTGDSRFVRLINTFNTLQENFFRKAAFDARLRQSMGLRGLNMADPSLVTRSEVQDAVNHGLELTFSEGFNSGPGKAVLDIYREIPFLTALGNPFPRFWMNALKFTYDFSPVPLFLPSTYSKMASRDPRIAFQALNRAALGTTMIGAGIALDRSGATGEKWYEIRSGDKTFDLRPFSPFVTNFFIGRLISRTFKEGDEAFMKLTGDDWSQAFLSLRRTDATGLPLLDMLFSRSWPEFRDKALRTLSSFVGSFTVTGRTAQDILGQFLREERLPRTTNEMPVVGEALANIPFAERFLPVRPSVFRSEPEERESPLIRQLTGLSSRKKTPVEMESDRLGLGRQEIYPRTGSPEFDRLIVKNMGPLVEKGLLNLMLSSGYQAADDKIRRFLFKSFLEEFRRGSKDITRGQRPDLALQEAVKRSEEFVREEMEKKFKERE